MSQSETSEYPQYGSPLLDRLHNICKTCDAPALEAFLKTQKTSKQMDALWGDLPDTGWDESRLNLVRVLMKWQKVNFDSEPGMVYAFLMDFPLKDYLDAAIEAGIHMCYSDYSFQGGWLKEMIEEVKHNKRINLLPLMRYITKPEVYMKTDLYPQYQDEIDRVVKFLAERPGSNE